MSPRSFDTAWYQTARVHKQKVRHLDNRLDEHQSDRHWKLICIAKLPVKPCPTSTTAQAKNAHQPIAKPTGVVNTSKMTAMGLQAKDDGQHHYGMPSCKNVAIAFGGGKSNQQRITAWHSRSVQFLPSRFSKNRIVVKVAIIVRLRLWWARRTINVNSPSSTGSGRTVFNFNSPPHN